MFEISIFEKLFEFERPNFFFFKISIFLLFSRRFRSRKLGIIRLVVCTPLTTTPGFSFIYIYIYMCVCVYIYIYIYILYIYFFLLSIYLYIHLFIIHFIYLYLYISRVMFHMLPPHHRRRAKKMSKKFGRRKADGGFAAEMSLKESY